MLVHDSGQLTPVNGCFTGGNHNSPAYDQWKQQLKRSNVKRESSYGEQSILFRKPGIPGDRMEEINQVSLTDMNSFGPSR
jgi:hypothetical protein